MMYKLISNIKKCYNWIKRYLELSTIEGNSYLNSKLFDFYWNDNLTPEQRRTINAVFIEIRHYYSNYTFSYYHPHPDIFKVLKKEYDRIIKKYKLDARKLELDSNLKYFYECFKQELIQYSNLEELIKKYT